MDPEKVKAILEGPAPRFTFNVMIFHRLLGFYQKFSRNFSQICVSLTKCMEKRVFQWTGET
jgi:hypothetical protein